MQAKKVTIINEVPIFPLPNVVFFPKTLMPLHIFELRYRRMVEDAIANEHLIAIALLRDGWEADYFGTPEVHQTVCVGKIQHSEKLEDGKYNVMLYGVSRAEIVRFVQHEPYRLARVKYLPDSHFDQEEFDENRETGIYISLVTKYLKDIGVDNLDELKKLRTHSLEAIVNQTASLLDFTTTEKQGLLEIDSLHARLERLKEMLEGRLSALQITRNIKFVPKDPTWN